MERRRIFAAEAIAKRAATRTKHYSMNAGATKQFPLFPMRLPLGFFSSLYSGGLVACGTGNSHLIICQSLTWVFETNQHILAFISLRMHNLQRLHDGVRICEKRNAHLVNDAMKSHWNRTQLAGGLVGLTH